MIEETCHVLKPYIRHDTSYYRRNLVDPKFKIIDIVDGSFSDPEPILFISSLAPFLPSHIVNNHPKIVGSFNTVHQ